MVNLHKKIMKECCEIPLLQKAKTLGSVKKVCAFNFVVADGSIPEPAEDLEQRYFATTYFLIRYKSGLLAVSRPVLNEACLLWP